MSCKALSGQFSFIIGLLLAYYCFCFCVLMEFLCLPMCVSVYLYASCASPFPVGFFFSIQVGFILYYLLYVRFLMRKHEKECGCGWVVSWERSKKSSVVGNHNQNDFIKNLFSMKNFAK